eukprot:CAMPEP_0185560250 /NCGR_PEP_ID=MMETSP1381-20130426/56500_1 /TAXON_ID=298111 /ORGANISM="Pavlova sp., Strain CCMP459" /LENGTH=49 /DNA_ID= /DNA_START= /DNA_END= /DNA_ORIENTATION=
MEMSCMASSQAACLVRTCQATARVALELHGRILPLVFRLRIDELLHLLP